MGPAHSSSDTCVMGHRRRVVGAVPGRGLEIRGLVASTPDGPAFAFQRETLLALVTPSSEEDHSGATAIDHDPGSNLDGILRHHRGVERGTVWLG